MKIKESDIISGQLYLNLVNNYKEYDKKQKKYIKELEEEVRVLKLTLNDYSNLQKKLSEIGITKRVQQYQLLSSLFYTYKNKHQK